MPLLEFAGETPSVLALPLAEQFFQEICLVGRMGPPGTAVLNPYRGGRLSVMLKFLRSLEMVRGLRFSADSRVAFCHQPDSGPSFGYTGTPDGPRPTEVAHSLLAFWVLQAEPGPTPHPAMVAVIANLARHGYEHAFHYLYDLNESGYLSQENLHTIARLLVNGRALTSTDEELVARLTDGRCGPEATDAEWFRQTLDWRWLLEQDVTAAAFPELLVERSWAEVGKLREAPTIDEWAAGMFGAVNALRSLGALLDAGRATNGIAVNAARAQLAELSADLDTAWISRAEGIGLVSIVGTVILADNAPQAQAGDEWRQRVHAERSIVPRAVFDGMLGEDTEWSRDDWFHLSWRTIVPWAAYHRPGESLTHRRGSYDGIVAGSLYPETPRDELTTAMHKAAADFTRHRYAEAIERLRPYEKLFPYAAPLHAMLAVNLDNSGAHGEALDVMLPALALDPTQPIAWTTGARVAYTNGCEPDAQVLEAFGTLLAREPG